MPMQSKKLSGAGATTTVATAGTRVQITTNEGILCDGFTVYNVGTGKLYFGDETVDNTWPPIEAGESASYYQEGYEYRLSDYFADSDINGTSFVVIYEQDRQSN